MPTSATVQGSEVAMTVETGVGKSLTEIPKSPRARFPRYDRYCRISGSSESVPSSSSYARRADGSTPLPRCCSFAIRMSTGSPGIIRGMKKFNVTAAQRATR
jgi:hypothetical protein